MLINGLIMLTNNLLCELENKVLKKVILYHMQNQFKIYFANRLSKLEPLKIGKYITNITEKTVDIFMINGQIVQKL